MMYSVYISVLDSSMIEMDCSILPVLHKPVVFVVVGCTIAYHKHSVVQVAGTAAAV